MMGKFLNTLLIKKTRSNNARTVNKINKMLYTLQVSIENIAKTLSIREEDVKIIIG